MNFLITAGPTREPIDPVRYLSNRSSGKMGYALANAAYEQGHHVTLISGPTSLPAPNGVEIIRIETAQQMHDVVQQTIKQSPIDVAIFAAAVADYRPKKLASQKIKKSADSLQLDLEKTPDILGSMRQFFGYRGLLVGFAAETENITQHAFEKLKRKQCDLIIANDVSRPDTGFDSEENEVILCDASGHTETIPQQSKSTLAHEIVRRCIALFSQRHHP